MNIVEINGPIEGVTLLDQVQSRYVLVSFHDDEVFDTGARRFVGRSEFLGRLPDPVEGGAFWRDFRGSRYTLEARYALPMPGEDWRAMVCGVWIVNACPPLPRHAKVDGEPDIFFEHVTRLFGTHDNLVHNLLAFLVQNPGRRALPFILTGPGARDAAVWIGRMMSCVLGAEAVGWSEPYGGFVSPKVNSSLLHTAAYRVVVQDLGKARNVNRLVMSCAGPVEDRHDCLRCDRVPLSFSLVGYDSSGDGQRYDGLPAWVVRPDSTPTDEKYIRRALGIMNVASGEPARIYCYLMNRDISAFNPKNPGRRRRRAS